MPKFGVTADLHFDEYRRLSTLHKSGLTTRLMDCIACWNWIVDTCAAEDCDGLIVLGDVFESRTEIAVPVLDCVPRLFKLAEVAPLDLHVLVGNHDSYLRTPKLHSLQTLLGVANIYSNPTAVKLGSISLGFVPWCDDQEEVEEAVDALVKDADYLFAHALVEGAVPKGAGIPSAVLQPQEFERVFLGDVHKPMHPIPGTTNVHYVGAPMQFDFSDAGEERGFSIIDTDSGKHEFFENTMSPRFRIIDGEYDAKQVRDIDFVRVEDEDPKAAAQVVEDLRGKTTWVEATTVEIEETPPRLDIRTKDSRQELLSRYVEHVHGKPDKALVKLGLEILENVEA